MRFVTALSLFALVVLAAGRGAAQTDLELPQQVQAARACAAEAAAVRDAYRQLRDHLKGSAVKARAEVLLNQAEEALARARQACSQDADAMRSFDALADDSDFIRRALGTPRR